MSATPYAEWLVEMEQHGQLDCKFVCPHCGEVSSPNDFKALGVHPERAVNECIGRHTKKRGCDWAAYGLFRGPVFVQVPNGCGLLSVFEFAEMQA